MLKAGVTRAPPHYPMPQEGQRVGVVCVVGVVDEVGVVCLVE